MSTPSGIRGFRVVFDPRSDHPWIVQGDTLRPGEWVDIATWDHADDAYGYIETTRRHQDAIDVGRRTNHTDENTTTTVTTRRRPATRGETGP